MYVVKYRKYRIANKKSRAALGGVVAAMGLMIMTISLF
jgi:hypothetical protein